MVKLSLGVDIGGSNTAFGLVDGNGDIYASSTFPTSSYPLFEDYTRYITELVTQIKTLLETVDFEYELVGIGIGAPNANLHRGTIENPPNLWRYRDNKKVEKPRMFNICDDIKKHFAGIEQVVITNDANAATIGEMKFGNGRGLNDFVMITLGTGLGSGVVANGELVCGHDGFAGEMGHITAVLNGRGCGCGRRGCLETYVSATGIKRTAFKLMARTQCDSPLRNISYNDFDAAMISAAAANGDALAQEIFRFTGELLGRSLADIATVTSPKAFIIFGGLAKAGDLLFAPTKKYLEESLFPAYRNKIEILPSALQDKNIAIIGAAALIAM